MRVGMHSGNCRLRDLRFSRFAGRCCLRLQSKVTGDVRVTLRMTVGRSVGQSVSLRKSTTAASSGGLHFLTEACRFYKLATIPDMDRPNAGCFPFFEYHCLYKLRCCQVGTS